MSRLSLAGQVDRRPHPPQGLLVLITLLALSAVGYWASMRTAFFHHAAAAAPDSAPVAPSAQPGPSDAALEDAQSHLRHLREALVHIQENTSRIEYRLNQVSPVLEQNYLQLERQRLEAADVLSHSVLREAGDALDELELTNQTLQTRRK